MRRALPTPIPVRSPDAMRAAVPALAAALPATGPHSHLNWHEALAHEHRHQPDIHHRHDHGDP